MNARIASLIAERLPGGLIHPGNEELPAKAIPLPGLASSGIPAEQAKMFAAQAGLPSNDVPKLLGEAIVHLIETDGDSEIISRAELEQLRREAATVDQEQTGQTVNVHCRCNRQEPALTVATHRAVVYTSGAAMKQRLNEVCTCS